MTPYCKPDGDVKGIVVGDIPRKLVAKTMQIAKQVAETTVPFQYTLITKNSSHLADRSSRGNVLRQPINIFVGRRDGRPLMPMLFFTLREHQGDVGNTEKVMTFLGDIVISTPDRVTKAHTIVAEELWCHARTLANHKSGTVVASNLLGWRTSSAQPEW